MKKITKKFKAVLFDMDGLMFDTENLWIQACVDLSKEYNIKNIDAEFVKTCIGANQATIDKRFKETMQGDMPLEQFRQAQYAYMNKYCATHGTPVKAGLYELIKYLKENNIKMALVSGSKKSTISHYLNNCEINASDFDAVLSCDDIVKSKPNPQGFLTACKMLNVVPQQCVVLEDSLRGVEAGFNAGCFTIMVPDLIAPTQETEKQANVILKDLHEVLQYFKSAF